MVSCHPQIVAVSRLLFPFGCFISFSWVITVVMTYSTMLNRKSESWHPCLIPDFREKAFRFSTLSMMLAKGSSYMTFIILSYVPSVLTLMIIYIMNKLWILLHVLSASIEMLMCFLSLILLIWLSHWFADNEPSLHS